MGSSAYLIAGILYSLFVIGFIRIFKGFGKIYLFLYTAVSLTLVIVQMQWMYLFSIFCLSILGISYLRSKIEKSSVYVPASIKIEGGGIKRGLTDPEAAMILGMSFENIIMLTLLGLFEKKFIVFSETYEIDLYDDFKTRDKSLDSESRSILRKKAAQMNNQVLYGFEEIFLEYLEQNQGRNYNDIDFGIIVKPFVKIVAERLGGYDLAETRIYYSELIERSKTEGRIDGVLEKDRNKVLRHNYIRILMGQEGVELLTVMKFSPDWYKGEIKFTEWLNRLKDEIRTNLTPDILNIEITDAILNRNAQNLLTDISNATFFG